MRQSVRIVIIYLVMTGAGISASICTEGTAFAGRYRAMPEQLEFYSTMKSSAVAIQNIGEKRGVLDISLSEWKQDGQGRDVYTETRDIVVYPKTMTVEPGEQRTVRAGYRGAAPITERIFRLLVTEAGEASRQGTHDNAGIVQARVLIFMKPDVKKTGVALERIGLEHGVVAATIQNAGNVHVIATAVIVHGLSAEGQEPFKKELAGSYVLSGASLTFSTEVPFPICRKLAHVEVDVATSSGALKGKLNINQDMCGP